VEISAAGRLEVRITAADVGKRVSVRRLTDDAAEGEKFTDTVGVLTSWDDGVLLITRRGGESVRIAESSLVAGKVVPAAPARRRGPAASYEELAPVAARAWRPVESERLGAWELRAAAGFTRRANSVLPLGDPGVPLDEALTYVRDWYAARELPAYIQTATGAEGTQELLCAELEARGWTREVTAELWIGSLAPVGDREAPGVVLSREADEAWLGRYQRKGLGEVALKVLGSGPSVWFATVPGAEGEAPVAIGRCVVDGRWAGFAAVEVAPAHRRQGLATAVMAALARRALEEGASAAWLQVEADNAGARALYSEMGFGPHHAYHHYRWTPKAPAAPAGDHTDERTSATPGKERAGSTGNRPSGETDGASHDRRDDRSGGRGLGSGRADAASSGRDRDSGQADTATGTGTGKHRRDSERAGTASSEHRQAGGQADATANGRDRDSGRAGTGSGSDTGTGKQHQDTGQPGATARKRRRTAEHPGDGAGMRAGGRRIGSGGERSAGRVGSGGRRGRGGRADPGGRSAGGQGGRRAGMLVESVVRAAGGGFRVGDPYRSV
jgi:GNAT superfamily N-acetyltransferase